MSENNIILQSICTRRSCLVENAESNCSERFQSVFDQTLKETTSGIRDKVRLVTRSDCRQSCGYWLCRPIKRDSQRLQGPAID